MPVVPGDAEAPRAVELGVLDAQGRRTPGPGPHILTLLAQPAALRARTREPQGGQVEAGDVAVGEGDRHALVPDDVDVRRLESFVALSHAGAMRMRREWALTT